MQRRTFITLIGAAAAWPRRQQSPTRLSGFPNEDRPAKYAPMIAAPGERLTLVGSVEGQNVATEFCWEEGKYDRDALPSPRLGGGWRAHRLTEPTLQTRIARSASTSPEF